jgi:hypothetical protein
MPNPDTARSIDPDPGEEIVEGTVIEAPPAPDPRPARSMELVRRERRSEVLRPLDREQVVASFREYQELCKQLLDESDYQRDGDRKFKKKSAWRKLATAFDLDVELIREHVERDHTGLPIRAAVRVWPCPRGRGSLAGRSRRRVRPLARRVPRSAFGRSCRRPRPSRGTPADARDSAGSSHYPPAVPRRSVWHTTML